MEQDKLTETIVFLEKTSSLIEFFHSELAIQSISDDRFKVLSDVMLWLTEWEEENAKAPGTPSEKKKMILAQKTIFDVKSMMLGFREFCRETFREHPSTYLLPWRITQIWWKIFSANKEDCMGRMTTPVTHSTSME